MKVHINFSLKNTTSAKFELKVVLYIFCGYLIPRSLAMELQYDIQGRRIDTLERTLLAHLRISRKDITGTFIPSLKHFL